MDNFEEKLGQLLSNPKAMETVLSLASSMAGNAGSRETPPPPPEAEPAFAPRAEEQPRTEQPGNQESPGLSSMLPGILTMLGSGSALGETEKNKIHLLHAIKPFVGPEHRHIIDRAVYLAETAKTAQTALHRFTEGGKPNV